MITLSGRTLSVSMEPRTGVSLLTLAKEAKIDWQYNCSRGTCAKCRCLVTEGAALLAEATDAEWDRLGEEELEQGYRLGCQAIVERAGTVIARNKTYF